MADGLFALEQSLKRSVASRKTRRARHTRGHHSMDMALPSPAELQQQIDVVQGKHLGSPSNSLRALEDRLLHGPQGARPPSTQGPKPENAQRQIQRLDHGQAPLQPETPPSASTTPPPPSAPANGQSVIPMAYAPELSAPDTGRFHVEPFSEPLAPESLLRPAPAVAAPAAAPQPAADQTTRTPAQPQTEQNQANRTQQASPASPLLEDDGGWLNQAREPAPQTISDASRNALDSSAALAADDFQRELAAILGKTPDQADGNQAPHSPEANRNRQESGDNTGTENEKNPPYPTHDIFDQMGLGMQYANSFDLGVANLQERFDTFDRELDLARAKPAAQSQRPATPFVDPFAHSMELDEIDLVAELAEIGADNPSRKSPPAQSRYKEETACPECPPCPPTGDRNGNATRQDPATMAPEEQQRQQQAPASPQNQPSASRDEAPPSQDATNSAHNPDQIEQTTGEDNEQPID